MSKLDESYSRYLASGKTKDDYAILHAAVQRYALRITRRLGATDPHEAAHQIAVTVWQLLGRFEGRSSFKTWVHRIAIRYMFDSHRRSKKERQTVVSDEVESGVHVVEPRIMISMDELHPELRSIVTLLLVGYNLSDISCLLGKSSKTIRRIVNRHAKNKIETN